MADENTTAREAPQLSKEDLRLASRVAESVALRDIHLSGMMATLQQPRKLILDHLEKHGGEIVARRTPRAAFDAATEALVAIVEYRMSFRAQDEQRTELIQVRAVYTCEYASHITFETDAERQQAFDAFAATNGVLHSWPYWRELVQSTLARMNLPQAVLPVFRLGHAMKPEREQAK